MGEVSKVNFLVMKPSISLQQMGKVLQASTVLVSKMRGCRAWSASALEKQRFQHGGRFLPRPAQMCQGGLESWLQAEGRRNSRFREGTERNCNSDHREGTTLNPRMMEQGAF